MNLTMPIDTSYNDGTTKSVSGNPHPSVYAVFLCLAQSRLYDGSREPNKTPSGNKFRRLTAVVEARHPTKVAFIILNCKEGIMPKHFTRNQNELIDTIALSLERLDSLLFFLENHHEEQHAYSVRYPNLLQSFEPRVLSLLYMANEAQRTIKENFEKLTFGDD